MSLNNGKDIGIDYLSGCVNFWHVFVMWGGSGRKWKRLRIYLFSTVMFDKYITQRSIRNLHHNIDSIIDSICYDLYKYWEGSSRHRFDVDSNRYWIISDRAGYELSWLKNKRSIKADLLCRNRFRINQLGIGNWKCIFKYT